MRRFDLKIKQAGLMALFVICISILLIYGLFNSDEFFGFGQKIIRILMPFIYGFFIAYILNPVLLFLENKLLKPLVNKITKGKKSLKRYHYRAISVFFTMAFFFLIVYALIIMIVPQVIESTQSIISKTPDYISRANQYINDIIADNKDFNRVIAPYTKDVEEWFMSNVFPKLQEWISNTSSNIIGGVYATITQMFKLLIGIIIAVFLLVNKEVYCAQAKKIAYALLREERANNLINNIRFTNKTFGGFLNGKIIDSAIIGVLTFIIISIFQIPYAVLISVIVGVTNIIPYFGPFLGALPSALIIMMSDSSKAFIFVIIIIVIQQIDGNIIGPKILGDSTGLSSFWVIFAITVFGGFFGVFGMFIGVPVFAVIYASIRTLVNERLKKKMLPDSTSYYIESDYHSEDNEDAVVNAGKEIKFVKKTFENIYVEGKTKKVIVTIDKDQSSDSNNTESSDK